MLLTLVILAQCQSCNVCASRVQAYVVEPLGSAAGVAMQSHRGASDQSADYTLQCKPGVTRDGDAPAIDYSCAGNTPFRVTNHGSVQAGSQQLPQTMSAFMAIGDVSAVGCLSSAEGCQTLINGGMVNGSFHGAVTLGNAGGIILRDGGLVFQVFGTGGALSPNHTVLAQDVHGNLQTYEGLHGSLVTEWPRCEVEGGFNNDVGLMRTLGMSGYDINDHVQRLCTRPSAQADGGWEVVITDRSLGASLAIINARLTALEAK